MPRSVRMLAWALLGMAVVVLAAPVIPLATGHEVVIVDGGSMRPTFDPGDVLLLDRRPTTSEVGDVVRVRGASGGYVHRVVEVSGGMLTLRGDANGVDDPGAVAVSDVDGVVVGAIGPPWAPAIVALTSFVGRVSLVLMAAACVAVLLSRSGEMATRLLPMDRTDAGAAR
jgi:signal peptidase I